MPQLLVRNLEPQLKSRLQLQAKRHGRSMEAEAREILRNALVEKAAPTTGLGTAIAALFQGIGLREGEEIAELRAYLIVPPDFAA